MATATMDGMPTALGSEDDLNTPNLAIIYARPYTVEVKLRGTSAMLFHRWQSTEVAAKAAAAKGSRTKKEDNVEAYVWRNEDGELCLPGEYLRGAICNKDGAAKYRQDPRSPRKSALDLFKASVLVLTELAPIVKVTDEVAKTWDHLDARRVNVQRNGITRTRPAILSGWTATFVVQVLQPQYVPAALMLEVLVDAGRYVGLADYRPVFGRFAVESYTLLGEDA